MNSLLDNTVHKEAITVHKEAIFTMPWSLVIAVGRRRPDRSIQCPQSLKMRFLQTLVCYCLLLRSSNVKYDESHSSFTNVMCDGRLSVHFMTLESRYTYLSNSDHPC